MTSAFRGKTQEKSSGIYSVLFGLSIYIFRYRLMPGKIYVVATVIFFTLATISLSFDLAFRFIAPMPGILILNQPTNEFFHIEGDSLQSRNIQSVPSYTFLIAGYVLYEI